MKKRIPKNAMALVLSLALAFSCLAGGTTAWAAGTRQSPHTTENFEGDYLRTYYGGTSNANSHTNSESSGMKYQNYDALTDATKAAHHMALPVTGEGIGRNGSNSAMALLYDDNYDTSSMAYNPGFSIRDNAGTGQSHQPLVNYTYYVSFYYKAESVPQAVTLHIAQLAGSLTNLKLSAINLAVDSSNFSAPVKAATISAAGEDWVKVVAKYTSTAAGTNLILFMNSSDKTNCKGTKILIDDISIDRLENTISFDTNGGSTVASISGYQGYAFDFPANPTKKNGIFAGWYTDAELLNPAENICTGDMTLYAKWDDADTSFRDFTQTFESASAISGKQAELTDTQNHTDSGTKSVKLSATSYQSNANTSRAVLDYENGNSVFIEKGHAYKISFWVKAADDYSSAGGNKLRIFTSSDPETTNYTVELDNNLSQYEGNLAADTWTKLERVVTVSGVGDASVLYLSIGFTVANGDAFGNFVYYLDDVSVTEVVYTTITFDSNGGTSVSSAKGFPNDELKAETPYKVGYTFGGWYFDNGTFTEEAVTYPVNDATAYAKWNVIVNTVQGYEDFSVETDNRSDADGIHGNGSGVRASDAYAHTGSKSVYLNMNRTESNTRAATILKSGTTNTDIRVEKGDSYKVVFWAYSEEAREIDFRLATWYAAIGTLGNNTGTMLSQEEAYARVSLQAGVWTEVTLVAPSIIGTTYESKLDYLAISATFDEASDSNAKRVYLDDIDVMSCSYQTGDVNANGLLDSSDMISLRKYLLGLDNYDTALYKNYFDMTVNDAVDIKDLVHMKKNIASVATQNTDDQQITIG